MTWTGFRFNGQKFLALCSKTMNFQAYQKILEGHFITLLNFLRGPSSKFQEGRATTYAFNLTKMFFNIFNSYVMELSSVSPNLNAT